VPIENVTGTCFVMRGASAIRGSYLTAVRTRLPWKG